MHARELNILTNFYCRLTKIQEGFYNEIYVNVPVMLKTPPILHMFVPYWTMPAVYGLHTINTTYQKLRWYREGQHVL